MKALWAENIQSLTPHHPFRAPLARWHFEVLPTTTVLGRDLYLVQSDPAESLGNGKGTIVSYQLSGLTGRLRQNLSRPGAEDALVRERLCLLAGL